MASRPLGIRRGTPASIGNPAVPVSRFRAAARFRDLPMPYSAIP